MRQLKNHTNVDIPDSIYPFGRARNNPGNNTGTRVDEELLGDMTQFFESIMALANLTPNNLPDNAYSGFQLLQALFLNIHSALFNPVYAGIYQAHPTTPIKIRRIGINLIQIQGCLYASAALSISADTIVMQLIAGLRPAGAFFWGEAFDFVDNRAIPVQILSNGEIHLRGDMQGFDTRNTFFNLIYRIDN